MWERLGARFRDQSSPLFKCKKRIFAHIFPDEDGESYIIRISVT